MDHSKERARDLLPTIVITVLSMIQALALELYWNRFRESDYLWHWGWDSAIGWLQLLVMLLGIIQVWLFYVSLVLRFSWLPTMEDTITPFIIGLLEFAMVDLMGPETLGPWFLALAAVFTVSIGASHLVMRRARRDAANDYFFAQVARASWRDYAGSIVVVLLLALFGVALWVSGRGGALAAAALLFALVALIVQLRAIHRYWMIMPEVVTPQSAVDSDVTDRPLPGRR